MVAVTSDEESASDDNVEFFCPSVGISLTLPKDGQVLRTSIEKEVEEDTDLFGDESQSGFGHATLETFRYRKS
jgi:hypothetical protein